MGYVTGRATGLAADSNGTVYAATAVGAYGARRPAAATGSQFLMRCRALSSGDLVLADNGSLWYATGEGNTGAGSYVGSGVYRLASPRSGVFTAADRVGGPELESTTISKLRFGGGKVWVATLRGRLVARRVYQLRAVALRFCA